MDDLKQAYAVLGLPEDADKETVEKRYYILIRQARAQQMRGEAGKDEQPVDVDAITRAYRRILEEEEKRARQQWMEQHYGKDEKKAALKAKIDHFFQYYKYHLLGAILLIAAVIYGVNVYLERKAEREYLASLPPPDLEIHFVGEFWPKDNDAGIEAVAEPMLARFPEWKRIVPYLTYVPQTMQTGQDYAFLQKRMVDLIQYKPDVYILDEPNFEVLALQGMFLRLDDPALGGLAASIPENVRRLAKAEEDPSPVLYGVELSGNPLLKEWPVIGAETVIVAVRIDTARPDKARMFIERLLEAQVNGGAAANADKKAAADAKTGAGAGATP